MSSPGSESARAEAMQAVYYRRVLTDQRAELAAELARAQKMLSRCLERGDLFATKRTQHEIRAKEALCRDLDRLICALDQRFGARRQEVPARR
jgi:hypothetical protein